MGASAAQASEYVFYVNGHYVPMSEARISVLDSCCHGDSVYDTLRTVNRRRVYRLEDHLERLFSSCRAAAIDPQMSMDEMGGVIGELVRRNGHLLAGNDDAWIIPRISSGSLVGGGEPTVMVMFVHLPFRLYAKFFILGMHVIVSSIRHVPPECMDPKIKNDSRLFMHIAERETRRIDPEAATLMLDIDGNVAELTDANFFIVKKGTVMTPTTRNVLPGVSRQVVLELCGKLGIPAVERDFQLYDVYNADEAFRTGTSYRMMPVSRVNLRRLWTDIPGPVTQRLLKAYSEEMGLDIAGQYLSHLTDEEREGLEREVAALR
ncbi:MAG: aminotransferase class IV [Candidatus Abyssubacteria bacterium]